MILKKLALGSLLFLIFSCSHEDNPLLRKGGIDIGTGAPRSDQDQSSTSPPVSTSCTEAAIASPTIIIGTGTPADPFIICNVNQLQTINNNLSSHYELGINIDATETSTWTDGPSGTGFIPIGGCGSNYADCSIGREYFSGSFNGNGYTIDGLYINRTRGAVGFFGATAFCSVVTNVRLTNANITGSEDTGGLVARLYSELSRSYFSGSVTGGSKTGGLVGRSRGTIALTDGQVNVNCTASECGGGVGDAGGSAAIVNLAGTVSGTTIVGGFGGRGSDVRLNAINTTVAATGTNKIGGMIGYSYGTFATQTSATGNVNGSGIEIGGFIGYSKYDYIYDSFATGDVSGNGKTGGFKGYNYYGYYSERNFATGNVDGGTGDNIGAFLGSGTSDAGADDSFATGVVSNGIGANVGGFSGNNSPTITNSFLDTNESTFHNMSHPVYTAGSTWALASSSDSKIWAAVPAGLPRFATLADQTITSAGSGTIDDPKIITSPAQFNELQTYAARPLHIRLANDLDFTATPIASLGQSRFPHFGNIEGNGRTVSNLDGSLVDSSYSATINNLNITNSTINDEASIATNCSSCKINNITASSLTVNGQEPFAPVGSLVGGSACIDISNVNVTANVNASSSNLGGIVGTLGGTLRDSTAVITLLGSTSLSRRVGGLVGNGGNITNVNASGSVRGFLDVGGIVGTTSGAITNVASSIAVTAGAEAGGAIGNSTGAQIIRSSVTGNVSAGSRTGGFIGRANGFTIENSYMIGNVNSSSGTCGGMVGNVQSGSSSIENSYFAGILTCATFQAGAITGISSSGSPVVITNSFSTDGPTNAVYSGPSTITNSFVDTPEATFYNPSNAVYTGSPNWDFTTIWNSPGGVALPTHQ